VRLYSDLKRHAMGHLLADPAGPGDSTTADFESLKYDGKPVKIAADQFLTAVLWGVGNTGPWLHDNRAGSLREAVLSHGEDAPPAVGAPGRSEAQEARRVQALAPADQDALVAFLSSLRTFAPPRKMSEEERSSLLGDSVSARSLAQVTPICVIGVICG
jgi:CxxC motif-containing protein (DUF1111 family)